MAKRNALRTLSLLALVLGTALLVASCASTPKTPDTPPDTKGKPVTAAEYAVAEKAIAEAEDAEASTYSSDLLDEAKDALAKARVEKDPDAARTLVQTSIAKANEARDKAWAARLAELDQQATAALSEASAVNAELYAPDLLKEAQTALDSAREKAVKEPASSKDLYLQAIEKANAARDAARVARLQALRDDMTRLEQSAQDAIAEAEAVDADQYAPAPLNQARRSLAEGRDSAEDDPKAATMSYESAIDKANLARETAITARADALVGRVDEALARYVALQPDRWDPEGATSVTEQADAAKSSVRDDYSTGVPLANEAIAVIEEATKKLADRLVAVQAVRVQAQTALDDAEKADAFVWVPELVQSANDSFFEGTGAWKKFQLDAAEEAWSNAAFQAKSAAGKAMAEQQRKQTEQLMLDTMKKLQDASGKTVVDPQDNIIKPQPWDGQKELDKLQKKPVSMLIPADGSVVVMGEVQRVTYLDQAKEQWAQGVQAMNDGDLTLANESFLQAQKLIDTYLALAVDKIYTVRLIPDRRDSLWRISEYGDIYSTPWDWPKIWKRNQKLIQNPDLIYPGWQLIIPPQ